MRADIQADMCVHEDMDNKDTHAGSMCVALCVCMSCECVNLIACGFVNVCFVFTSVCVWMCKCVCIWMDVGVWMNVYAEKKYIWSVFRRKHLFLSGFTYTCFESEKIFLHMCVCLHVRMYMRAGVFYRSVCEQANVCFSDHGLHLCSVGWDSPSLLSWVCTTEGVFSSHQVKEESKVTLAHLELASEEKWVPLEYQVWKFSISGWVDINHRGRAQGSTPSCGKRRGWATVRRNRTLIVYWNISQVLEEYLLSQKSQSLIYCLIITSISVSNRKIW